MIIDSLSIEDVKNELQRDSDFFSKEVDGRPFVHAATARKRIDILKLLIELKCPIEFYDKDGYTPLHIAVIEGNLPILKLFTNSGFDVGYPSRNGFQPAILAVMHGQVELIDHIVNCNADLSRVARNGTSFFQQLLKFNHIDLLEKLIRRIDNVGYVGIDGNNLGHFAAAYNRFSAFSMLQNAGVNLDAQNWSGATPLMIAVENEFEESVNVLTRLNVDVNICDIYCNSPLLRAIDVENPAIVKQLLNADANTNAKSRGKTPLMLAKEKGANKIVELLNKQPSMQNNLIKIDEMKPLNSFNQRKFAEEKTKMKKRSLKRADSSVVRKENLSLEKMIQIMQPDWSLSVEEENFEDPAKSQDEYTDLAFFSVKSGDIDMLKKMFNIGCINTKIQNQKTGDTLMHQAVKGNQTEILTFLLKRKARVDVKNNNDETPFHLACQENSIDCVRILIEQGVDINQSNGSGRTPLALALKTGNRQLVEELLAHGSTTGVQDQNGNTILHEAVDSENLEIFSLILKNTEKMNARNLLGQTALHLDCYRKDVEKTVLLLEDERININLKDIHGNTPLHVAMKYGNMAKIILLLERGTRLREKNLKNETPLDVAMKMGYLIK